MIEPIMYFGIGFLVAALLGLLFVPLVHNRAVRLTMRRLEAATPLSIAEIRADKDQLRAEFAMSTRRLEMSVEQMKTKTTASSPSSARRPTPSISSRKSSAKRPRRSSRSRRATRPQRDQLRATEEEFEIKTGALREAERTLADKEAELVKLVAELGERSITADSQRVELAALRTQVEAMKVSVADYERTVKDDRAAPQSRAQRIRSDGGRNWPRRAASSAVSASAPPSSNGSFCCRPPKPKYCSRRVQELETGSANRAALLAERDYQIERLRSDARGRAPRPKPICAARLASVGGRSCIAADKFRSEIEQLEAQLAAAVEERTKLQREIAAMKRDAESTWASERVENALLRERINDVAAEVARLTAALEGPGSPIDSMLAVERPPWAKAASRPPHPSSTSTASRARRPPAAWIRRRKTRPRWPTASARCNRPPRGWRRRTDFT